MSALTAFMAQTSQTPSTALAASQTGNVYNLTAIDLGTPTAVTQWPVQTTFQVITSIVPVTIVSTLTASFSSCALVTKNAVAANMSIATPDGKSPACPGLSLIDATLPWQSAPTGRGTFSILAVCLTTLTLCIWTALHPNVPSPNDRAAEMRLETQNPLFSWPRRIRNLLPARAQWIIIGLLAPEVVVYFAWSEWLQARDLHREIRKFAEEERIPLEWTMTHSFFATMGGFCIRYPGGSVEDRVILTREGLLHHLSHSPKDLMVSEDSIRDRSKADYLAKFLVCVQALYMLIQCAARLRAGMPITLLELNTIGHIFCAFLMYMFWFNKPLDVHDPFVLEVDWVLKDPDYWEIVLDRRPAAIIERDCLGSYLTDLEAIGKDALRRSELDLLTLFMDEQDRRTDSDGVELVHHRPHADDISRWSRNDLILVVENGPHKTSDVHMLDQGNLLESISICYMESSEEVHHRNVANEDNSSRKEKLDVNSLRSIPRGLHFKELGYLGEVIRHIHHLSTGSVLNRSQRKRLARQLAKVPELTAICIDVATMRRWNLAINGLLEHTAPFGHNRYKKVASLLPQDTPDVGVLRKYTPRMAITLATALYGGLHVAAWNSYFPSKTEQWCWRISGLMIASTGIMVALYLGLVRLGPVMLEFLPDLPRFRLRQPAESDHMTSIIRRNSGEPNVGAANSLMPHSVRDSQLPTSHLQEGLHDVAGSQRRRSDPSVVSNTSRNHADSSNDTQSGIKMQTLTRNRTCGKGLQPHDGYLVTEVEKTSARSGCGLQPLSSDHPDQCKIHGSHNKNPVSVRNTHSAISLCQDHQHNQQHVMNSHDRLPFGVVDSHNATLQSIASAPALTHQVKAMFDTDEPLDSYHSNASINDVKSGPHPISTSGVKSSYSCGSRKSSMNTSTKINVIDPSPEMLDPSSSNSSHQTGQTTDSPALSSIARSIRFRSSLLSEYSRSSEYSYDSQCPYDSQHSFDSHYSCDCEDTHESEYSYDSGYPFSSDYISTHESYDDSFQPSTGRASARFSPAQTMMLVAYTIARSFLVVESFLSLRRLPVEAYQTPAWTIWLVHFGG